MIIFEELGEMPRDKRSAYSHSLAANEVSCGLVVWLVSLVSIIFLYLIVHGSMSCAGIVYCFLLFDDLL